MRRFLSSFRVLVAAAILLSATAIPALAQIYDGCDDSLTISGSSGRTWNCYIDGADDDWCYYTCYAS
jgi:hypothetical protein